MRRLSLSGAAALFLAVAVPAQTSLQAPFRAAGREPQTGLAARSLDAAVVQQLPGHRELVLRDFALPSGAAVDLALQRVDLARLGMGFHVDRAPAPGLLDGLDLSVWTGRVAGDPHSEVVLSFSRKGTRGWIATGGELVHVLPRRDELSGFDGGEVLLATDAELAALGMRPEAFCDAGDIQSLVSPDRPPAGRSVAPGAEAGGSLHAPGGDVQEGAVDCEFWECTVAIEADFQLFQVFGNDLGAESAYIATLLAAVSARYQEQIDTLLSFPYVNLNTSSNDGWSTPDLPGGSGQMLDEFVAAWSGNVPGGARLGHFLSGAGLGGGIAYLGVLCDTDQNFTFAVSGNLDGDTPFPISVNPFNWDFMVTAHETGHNFNSPHTHDFVPPIDNCANDVCITDGTIMSYCHLCPGGMTNITTFFHPITVDVMTAHAGACLPFFAPLVAGAAPSLVPSGLPIPVSVVLQGSALAGVDLHWRHGPGDPFTVTPATFSGFVWTAAVPAPSCGDQPEWFFSTTEASCGAYQTPVASAEVGVDTLVLLDELEVASGWTAGVGGDSATTGQWTRSNPIGTAAQPEDDHTPAGSDCFFTGQGPLGGGLGDADIDGGTTTLLSPVIDVTGGGDVRVEYWRWYSNDTGAGPNADVFTVDASDDGGGSWVNVETVGPAGAGTSGGWIRHEFAVADFVDPTAQLRLRFRAADLGEGSLVEAAVDDLRVFRVACDDGPWVDLGGGAPGIAGVPSLALSGPLTPLSQVTLQLDDAAPSALVVLFLSFSSSPAPFLGGTLHASPPTQLVLLLSDGAGSLGGSATWPGAPSGTSIWFQAGVVDASVPVHGASLSNGVVGTVP